MDDTQGNSGAESPLEFAWRLGLEFSNIGLLLRALTHRSYINENRTAVEDNERLEFLGDAVLDFLVGAWLYHRFPDKQEGFLTRLRAALVGNQQLAAFARQIGLGAVMLLGRGEAEGGGRDRDILLGSTFEALVGAIYLDKGIPAVKTLIDPLLRDAVKPLQEDDTVQDPKSQLQEWSQAAGSGAPIYRMAASVGPDHEKHFTIEVLIQGQVVGVGSGKSKREAAKSAAQCAIHHLVTNPQS